MAAPLMPPPDEWERVQIGLAYLNKAQKQFMDGTMKEAAKHLDSCRRALGSLANAPDAPIWGELGINLPKELTRLTYAVRQRSQRRPVAPPEPDLPPFSFEDFPESVRSNLLFLKWMVAHGKVSDG